MTSTIDMSVWAGRVDADEGPRSLRWHQAIQSIESAQAPGIALLGFASDEGVRRNQGRVGARRGPRALREALSSMAVHQERPLYDAGDIICKNGDLEFAHNRFSDRVAALLNAGHFPMGLGGGHEIAYGTFTGLAEHFGKTVPRIGIVNLDAHFDLRQAAQPNSGTSFLRIAEFCRERQMPFDYCCLGIAEHSNTAALFDRAIELGVTCRTDDQLCAQQLGKTLEILKAFTTRVDYLYLTICLDVLPACIAPGVSAPAARGVPLEIVEALVDEVKRTGKLAAADVAELNPDLDLDGRTARTAARLVYRITR